jgi:hypothetical protein
MSFVTIDEFQTRYENTIPAADEERVEALLGDACDLAADIIGKTYAEGSGSEVPSIITAKVCEAVRRAYENPSGLQGETIGDYSWRGSATGSASIGVYFTPGESRIMRRAAGRSGAGAIQLETNMADAVEDDELYLSVTGSSEPVLYFDREDIP